MKFRAVAHTDLLVSEVALALDAPSAPVDPVSTELLIRLACDEGINLILATGDDRPSDAGIGVALDQGRRAKVSLAMRLPWRGEFDALSDRLARRLLAMGLDRPDLLILEGVSPGDLQAGAVGDAVHRLRASGRIGQAGLRASALIDAGLIERNGFCLVAGNADTSLPCLVDAPRFDDADVSFLWDDAGRTPAQAAVQMALSRPEVCSVFIRPSSTAGLRELARAPLAPPLSAREIFATREVMRGIFPREAVEA